MRIRTLVGRCCGVVAVVALVNGAVASDAEACSCLMPTVESSYNNATDVISAEVRREFVLGSTRYYLVRVQRTFKGCLEPRDWVLLSTPGDSAACGADLNERRHLINGTAAGSRFGLPVLSISLCSYDVPVSALTDQDRAFLEGRTVCCGDECTCADGTLPVQCFVDPCEVAPACGDGQCVANYCGGCNAEFYDPSGYAVCQADDTGCVEDSDCAAGEWCRQAQNTDGSREPVYECVPFVGAGESCNGFTTPWDYERCAEGLTCDTPDFIIDASGICRPNCETDADCGEGEYCASDKLCDVDGACEREVDCNLPGNAYPHIECVGHGVCGDDRQCGWECGVPQCVDLSGFDFGPCDAVLGWGVVDGACTEISGCGTEWKLFATADECKSACS